MSRRQLLSCLMDALRQGPRHRTRDGDLRPPRRRRGRRGRHRRVTGSLGAATREVFPELWRDEKREPHKPKALFLETFGEGGTVVDISDTMDTKIKALLVHKSQLGPEAAGFIRDWNKRTGKSAGY